MMVKVLLFIWKPDFLSGSTEKALFHCLSSIHADEINPINICNCLKGMICALYRCPINVTSMNPDSLRYHLEHDENRRYLKSILYSKNNSILLLNEQESNHLKVCYFIAIKRRIPFHHKIIAFLMQKEFIPLINI